MVDALVATMRWIDALDRHPQCGRHRQRDAAGVRVEWYDQKQQYIFELATDTGQFLPDGMLPPSAPATALAVDKFAGNVTGPVNIASTYTNRYPVAANKLEGFTK